jgi:hypothetical protein
MIITEFDKPLTAEDARKISINNRDDSIDRGNFRDIMSQIQYASSIGHTRLITSQKCRSLAPSEMVQKTIRSFGFRVIEKRAYKWDEKIKDYSTEHPLLDFDGREQFFLEITWG